MALGDFALTKRGPGSRGTVVDGGAPGYTLEGARVLLLDESGHRLPNGHVERGRLSRLTGQITTQSVTLVVDPADSRGYMQAESYCVFQPTVVPDDWQVTTGRETSVGDVDLDRAPDDVQPSDICKQG